MGDPELGGGNAPEPGLTLSREDQLVLVLNGKTVQIAGKNIDGVAKEIERAFLRNLQSKVSKREKPDAGDLYTFYILTMKNTIHVHVSEAGAVTASKAV